MWRKKTEQSRQKLSRAMGSYWASFARTGKPAAKDQPNWPVFGDAANLIYFDSVNDGGIEVKAGADNVASLIKDLNADTRINAEQRCEIAEGLLEWTPTLEGPLSAVKDC